MSEYHVLIPCAGHGSRMQSVQPKQYVLLHGKPLLRHAIDVFEAIREIRSITIVVADADSYWQDTLLEGCLKTHVVACGGDTRAATVLNGLKTLNIAADDWVLVHDAARPGIDAEMLARLFVAAENSDVGAILALPLADTLKRADDQAVIIDTQPRDGLWQAQTPQMFRHAPLQQALSKYLQKQPTDEAQAMEWMGYRPQLAVGGLKNLKVTYPQDLQVVAALMQPPAVSE